MNADKQAYPNLAEQANALPNPDYSKMNARELSIEFSKYDAVMKRLRGELIVLETEAGAAREAGTTYPKIGELGETRIKFLHSVRQIVRVREEQQKRGQTNHVNRAIRRGKAARR